MKSFKVAAYAILGFGLAIVAACSTGSAMADQQPPPAQPAATSELESYRLGTGDEIKVTVLGETDLTGPFTVDGQGAITMLMIGEIKVRDLSLKEVQQTIETKLKSSFIREPQVTVDMIKGRPYYILGEVNKAGEYPFTSGLTVMNAVAAAGDFTYRADKKKIMITSANTGVEREVVLTPSTPVKPGDRIRIRERFF